MLTSTIVYSMPINCQVRAARIYALSSYTHEAEAGLGLNWALCASIVSGSRGLEYN